jgi:hypothetical protein
MTEPIKTHCPRCGSTELQWPDIVAALEDMLPNMGIGMRPLALQAIRELREARERESWRLLMQGVPYA